MTRDTLGSIVRVARSPTAKWVAGAVLSGVLAVAGWALTLASEVARKPDVAAAVAVHDHGHAEALPKDGDGRLRPSHEDLVTGLAAARATIRLLEQHQVQQDALMVSTLRWVVRGLAADAEPRRARKMEAGREAEAEFVRLTDQGMEPAKAARTALRGR